MRLLLNTMSMQTAESNLQSSACIRTDITSGFVACVRRRGWLMPPGSCWEGLQQMVAWVLLSYA
jgi:hypothetical protein